jgi:glucose-6-phosphate 1-epimerase
MVDRSNKPSALSPISPGLPPQAQVNITHSNARVTAVLPTGESVEILLYGATIVSWKDATGKEKLFLSDKAAVDGSKAVRGGIPLVFPVFGKAPDHAATAALPQHGFARTSRWEFLGKSTSESSRAKDGEDSSVKLDFGLSQSNLDAASKDAWPHAFGLIYSVTLGREGLTTSIVVRNEGESAWDFQVLVHSYFRVNVRPRLPHSSAGTVANNHAGYLQGLYLRPRVLLVRRQAHHAHLNKHFPDVRARHLLQD